MQLETKLAFVSLTGQRADLLTADEYIGDLWSLLSGQFTITGESEFSNLAGNAIGE